MTEPPPGAGADPNMLRTRAERKGDQWVINGDKWYITGADGAAFTICMAVTSDADRPGRAGATMFFVELDNPGVHIVRQIPSLDAGLRGGHCEVEFRDCVVGEDAVLGKVGEGFAYAQLRLAPARLTHCMRWLGVAQRALDIAAGYAAERESFGTSARRAPDGAGDDRRLGHRDSRRAADDLACRVDARSGRAGAARDLDGEGLRLRDGQSRDRSRAADLRLARRLEDLPLAMFYRNARPFRIYDGPSEVHRMVIARNVLRLASKASGAKRTAEKGRRPMELADLFRLDGKVALVTGGGRGIGKTIAEALAGAGARIVITGRRAEWLTPAEAELREQGFDCTAVIADVTQPDDADRVTQVTLDAYGTIDILVNNAGQTWGQPTEDLPLEKWRQVVETNLTGAFIMSQRAGRHMLERGQGGRIINIASIAGIVAGEAGGMPTIAYNASKAALISFTRSLAMEWGRRGILVNAIAPGWFPTRMAAKTIETYQERILSRSALGRIGDLNELRGAAVFLASPASSYITGQTLVVDGGLSL